MSFLLGGTICLAHAHGHSNNPTKPKLRYKFGSVYLEYTIGMTEEHVGQKKTTVKTTDTQPLKPVRD